MSVLFLCQLWCFSLPRCWPMGPPPPIPLAITLVLSTFSGLKGLPRQSLNSSLAQAGASFAEMQAAGSRMSPLVALGIWHLLVFLRWSVKVQIQYSQGHLPKSNGGKLLTRFSLPGEEAGESLLPEAFVLTLGKICVICWCSHWAACRPHVETPQTTARSGFHSWDLYSNLGTSWKTQQLSRAPPVKPEEKHWTVHKQEGSFAKGFVFSSR